jgi:uncharacterized protein (TIGR02246 family)
MIKSLAYLMALFLLGVSLPSHAIPPAAVSIEDKQQIQDLISTYSQAYDRKDIEGFLALFTKDCVWEAYASGAETPMVSVANRDALRAVTVQRFEVLQQKGIQSRHFQTNTILVVRPDGQVEGTTMLNLIWQVPSEKPYTVTTGIYHTLFVKAEGGWRIAKRTLMMDQSEFGK